MMGDASRSIGGAGGIRTLDTVLPYTHFPGERLRPLGHRSAYRWKERDLTAPKPQGKAPGKAGGIGLASLPRLHRTSCGSGLDSLRSPVSTARGAASAPF